MATVIDIDHVEPAIIRLNPVRMVIGGHQEHTDILQVFGIGALTFNSDFLLGDQGFS